LSDNSECHFEPSSLSGPEETFLMALVTDFAPNNVAYFQIIHIH